MIYGVVVVTVGVVQVVNYIAHHRPVRLVTYQHCLRNSDRSLIFMPRLIIYFIPDECSRRS